VLTLVRGYHADPEPATGGPANHLAARRDAVQQRLPIVVIQARQAMAQRVTRG